MSNDPQQDYFSDGLTEDLITDLAKVPGLFVVARNSVFTYKGKPVRVDRVGRELGVRYVLEGSARKADNQVRITAQLVDAVSGFHLWADHYDRPLTNIFKVQDEIRQKIVFALKVKLSPEEQQRFKYASTSNMEAYDLYLRAGPEMLSYTREKNQQARRLLEQAVKLDPEYSAAYMALAGTYEIEWMWAWNRDPEVPDRAFSLAQQAVDLDDSSPMAHAILGDAYKIRKQLDHSIAEGQRSIALGPSCSLCYGELAEHLMCAGHPAQALELLDKALRLDPHVYRADYQFDVAIVHALTGRRDQAIDELKEILIHQPDFVFAHGWLAGLYADQGNENDAKVEAARVVKLISPMTIAQARAHDLQYNPCVGVGGPAWRHGYDTLQRLTTAVAKAK